MSRPYYHLKNNAMFTINKIYNKKREVTIRFVLLNNRTPIRKATLLGGRSKYFTKKIAELGSRALTYFTNTWSKIFSDL